MKQEPMMSDAPKAGRGRTEAGRSDEFWTPMDIRLAMQERNGAGYEVDFAATKASTLAPRWFGPGGESQSGWLGRNALKADWAVELDQAGGPGWCNPPFSKPNLPLFTGKALEAAPHLRHRLDLLVPASTRTGWKKNGEPGWFGRLWSAGGVDGGSAINHGPLRGQVLRLVCPGFNMEILLLGYTVRFLDGGTGKPCEAGSLGSHCIISFKPLA